MTKFKFQFSARPDITSWIAIFSAINSDVDVNEWANVNFPIIADHQYDRCSFEKFNGSRNVHCNWQKMALKSIENISMTTRQFQLVNKGSLISKSCSSKNKKSDNTLSERFAMFSGDIKVKENTSSAYLLSPLFVSTGKLSISFLDYQSCEGSRLQAFFIAGHLNGSAIKSLADSSSSTSTSSSAFLDLISGDSRNITNKWRFNRVVKVVPNKYEKFHVSYLMF